MTNRTNDVGLTLLGSMTPHSVFDSRQLNSERRYWYLVAISLFVLFAPTLWSLFNGIWSTDQQGHGPIVLLLSLWLIRRNWSRLQESDAKPSAYGWVLITVGVTSYIVGRSQELLLLEVGSVIWVLAGLCVITFGCQSLKVLWFALFFMLFMIPLPGALVDALTQPMKTLVSYLAETTLFELGYPVARTGVVLQIGQYRLLVADACAGLHTLFTLEALGLFYLNVVRHESAIRNIAMAILIIPISLTANAIRVITLTLITYYLGDEAGQGFLHGFSGMVLFLSALMLILAADALSRRLSLIAAARTDKSISRARA